ncbi:MAG: hypothetical protein ACPG7F_17745 [Aggregatilineales bacterium]
MSHSLSILEQLNQDAENIYSSVRVYMPELAKRLGMTYVMPVFAGLLAGSIVLILASQILPGSTATILSVSVNLLIMVFGWRMMERRTAATQLFVAYTGTSKERRDFQRLLDDESLPQSTLETKLQHFEDRAIDFIAQMKQQGAKPALKKQAE